MNRLFCWLLCLALLTACSPAVTPQPTLAPTVVPATATALPPTATPTQSPPTVTPLPTNTSTPEPTSTPLPITAGNVAGLELARRAGQGRVEQVVWSPDGNSLALLTSVHLLRVDAQSGETIWKVETGPAQQQVAFSADGKRLVTLGAGGATRVWDAANGVLLSSPVPQQINILVSSLAQDGSIVAMTNVKRETAIWDVANGVELFNNQGGGMPAEVSGVLAGPDGSWFATSGYDTYGPNQQIKLWEAKTGKPILGLLGINNDFITDLAASPDGKYVAGISRLMLTSVPEFSLVVWDTKTGAQLQRFTQNVDIVAFAFTSEDTLVFCNGMGDLQTASISTGKLGSTGASSRAQTFAIAVSPDGGALALAGSDGALRLWDMRKRAELQKIALELSSRADPDWLLGRNYLMRYPRAFAIGLPADGAFILMPSTDRTSLSLVDPLSLLSIRTLGKSQQLYSALAASPDGKWAAAAEYETVSVWDVASGRLKQTIRTGQRNVIQKLMFSPDSTLIYALSSGELCGYEVESGKRVKNLAGFNTLDFSPDGNLVISDNVDFGLYFWDAASGRQLALPSADWILDVDFSPDGKNIAISGWEVHKDIKEHTNLVTFMDSASYAMSPLQVTGNVAQISHVRYSPDGSLLATLDDYGNLQLWDGASGERLALFEGVAPAPGHVEFFSQGRALVVGSADGTLRFYEVKR